MTCQRWLPIGALAALLWLLAACAPAAPTSEPTAAPAVSTPRPTSPPPAPTPIPFIEQRFVELEWPERLRLGESDVLRLALVPSKDGYLAQAEFEEHPIAVQDAPLRHLPGYTLLGLARLDGVGFDISPAGEQMRLIPPGERVTWRWSLAARQAGRQRLSLSLTLRWQPEPGVSGPVSESLAFDRALDVQVDSLLGLTRDQALLSGVLTLLFGGSLGAAALVGRHPLPARRLQEGRPNPALAIENSLDLPLSAAEIRTLQALFARYQRLVLESEFRSGYSGARALLVRPLWADGQADAPAIAKLGHPAQVLAEHQNYEQFVKDRLPPVTARIQHPPLRLRGSSLAALQYTFIAEPGRLPLSLRQALLQIPDPAPLRRLFDTFGPSWWMQRQPYTFRLAQEYDRLLPPHWVLEPAPGAPGREVLRLHAEFRPSQVVRLPELSRRELRPDGCSWALEAAPSAGQPPLRLRWLGAQPPSPGASARLQANRLELLHGWVAGFDRYGLPDPLERLEGWLAATLQGTRSVIHGDLNLENILVGPGDLVWLIDFAATRQGHPLFDFAHLAAEIAAHVLVVRCASPERFHALLQAGDPLLAAVESLAGRCLFDPARPQEYHLALAVTCLGALKYPNLDDLQRRCLYLLAAQMAGKIE
jgi:hypothetical protein